MQETIDKLNKSFSKLIKIHKEGEFSFNHSVTVFLECVFEGFMKSNGYKEVELSKNKKCTDGYFRYDEDSGYIIYKKSKTQTDGFLKYLHSLEHWKNIILKYFNQFYISETK